MDRSERAYRAYAAAIAELTGCAWASRSEAARERCEAAPPAAGAPGPGWRLAVAPGAARCCVCGWSAGSGGTVPLRDRAMAHTSGTHHPVVFRP